MLATGFRTTACGAAEASRARPINKCIGPVFSLTHMEGKLQPNAT
jgi:hypothetical protein